MAGLAAATVAISCGADAPERADPSAAIAGALERLRAFETTRRSATDFRTLPPADLATGPNPIAIRRMPGQSLLLGLLRGRAALVLLDEELHERGRVRAPGLPTGLAIADDGDILVSGEASRVIARYALRGSRLVRRGGFRVPGPVSIRALAAGPDGVVYAADDRDDRLLTLDRRGRVLAGEGESIGLGPRHLLRTEHHLLVNCVLAHTVVIRAIGAAGIPLRQDEVRVTHDGPLWAMDARETDDGLLVAVGGIEDHPLDRTQGSFGYIDSFVWLYRITGTPPAATRLAAVNVSALGVVTPKVVTLLEAGAPVRLRVRGYGDAPVAELVWNDPRPTRKGLWPQPAVQSRRVVPGAVMEAPLTDGRTAVADPLLDTWVLDDGVAARQVAIADEGRPPRSTDARLGEALVFTTLMAPWNRTRGSLSRFTCEACHFEGGVDGRVHYTGRDDVHVSTRPLLGLFNDRPYFSRALDPDLTSMAHNEFRVAGLRSRHDPWFPLSVADVPWLSALDVGTAPLAPERLRRALMTFLMEFTPNPNPSVLGRRHWSPEERRGAELFRDRCAGCHAARLVTDQPGSLVPFDAWERLVMSPLGPLVWARPERLRTGITPYVHDEGTRVPSLRRLYRKRPYFTNGSAPDLGAVLQRARFTPDGFLHGAPPETAGERLAPGDRAALRAFLDLL